MHEEVVVVQNEYGMEERDNEMKPMRRSCHWPMVQPQERQVLLVAAKVVLRAMLCTSTQRLGTSRSCMFAQCAQPPCLRRWELNWRRWTRCCRVC